MHIITVSRLVGSYGDQIAEKVAERMGLEFIGRTGLHELARSCDPAYGDACEVYETEHGPGFFERLFFDRPMYASLFEALTYEQAARGNVVMVGRGAQLILKDVPGVFGLRVVAPLTLRVERVAERHACSRDEAAEYIEKYDRERDTLIQAIFGSDLSDRLLYDMVLNTEHYEADAAADVVLAAVEKTIRVPDRNDVIVRLSNMAVAKRIETLARKKMTSAVARNVRVSFEAGGLATLTGRVREKRDKENVETLVSQYPGVSAVTNELKVMDIAF